jgi:hypothetical protein
MLVSIVVKLDCIAAMLESTEEMLDCIVGRSDCIAAMLANIAAKLVSIVVKLANIAVKLVSIAAKLDCIVVRSENTAATLVNIGAKMDYIAAMMVSTPCSCILASRACCILATARKLAKLAMRGRIAWRWQGNRSGIQCTSATSAGGRARRDCSARCRSLN